MDQSTVELLTTKGTGPGGQHRNTRDTTVVAKHKPTGIVVRIDGRSQKNNKRIALAVLAERVHELKQRKEVAAHNAERKRQIGSGQRGDKIRTYRVRDNTVTDHRSGAKCPLDKWQQGLIHTQELTQQHTAM